MPKSKRAKHVSLTKTVARPHERKTHLVSEVQKAAREYNNVFVIIHHGTSAPTMQEVRRRWSTSRFILGKNRVMAVALGRDPETELFENLRYICPRLKNKSALMFTNESPEEVIKYFEEYKEIDFLRTGMAAPKTVTLNAGILAGFPHSIEPRLRRLNLHTRLKMGEVELLQDTVVCSEGETVTPEQCQILKLLDMKLAEFQFDVDSYWEKDKLEFTQLASDDSE